MSQHLAPRTRIVSDPTQTGATAVIEPGGSLRDADAIAAADQYNLALIFTGTRHFRH